MFSQVTYTFREMAHILFGDGESSESLPLTGTFRLKFVPANLAARIWVLPASSECYRIWRLAGGFCHPWLSLVT